MASNRGKFLIDKSVQMSLVRRVVLHWVSFIALFFLIVLTLEMFMREPGVGIGQSMLDTLKKNTLIFVLMVAVMPAFLYDTVKMSNRFAGPVSRLKQGLSALAKGQNVEPMNFRKGDFWGELAEDFNRVAVKLTSETDGQSELTATSDNQSCNTTQKS
jgi:hypothetical protein